MISIKIEKVTKSSQIYNNVYLTVISPSVLENETFLLPRHDLHMQGNCYAHRTTTCNVGKS